LPRRAAVVFPYVLIHLPFDARSEQQDFREENAMTHPDIETMKTAYELANGGDIPAMLRVMDSRVEWHEPGGGNAPAGTFNGVDEVLASVFGSVPGSFTEYRAEPDRFLRDGAGNVVVSGTFRARTTSGRDIEAPFVHVWSMRDGKVVRLTNHVDADAWGDAWAG
jgi:ketosteroid isomerase-like protein